MRKLPNKPVTELKLRVKIIHFLELSVKTSSVSILSCFFSLFAFSAGPSVILMDWKEYSLAQSNKKILYFY